MQQSTTTLHFLLWIARIWAMASVAFLTLFVVAHLQEAGPSPTALEWLGLAFFPAGVMAGLLAAMKYPVAGGGFVLSCLSAFYLWNYCNSGAWPAGFYFIALSAPGLLFLIYGLTLCRKD